MIAAKVVTNEGRVFDVDADMASAFVVWEESGVEHRARYTPVMSGAVLVTVYCEAYAPADALRLAVNRTLAEELARSLGGEA